MATVITTSATSYANESVVVVKWTGSPGNALDWVSIAPDGSPLNTYYAWVYTDGAVDGQAFFIVPNGGPNPVTPITPGNYVARMFVNDTIVLDDESPVFAVRDAIDGSLTWSDPPPLADSDYSLEEDFDLSGVLHPRRSGSSNYSFCTCEAGTPSIHTDGIDSAQEQITVTFTSDVVLSGPALETENWFVTTEDTAKEVRITNIEFSGNTVTLTTTPQTLDANYTLHLPSLGITSDVFGIFTGLYSLDFVGVPTPVTVQMVKVVDTHHLDVIFGIAVDPDDASDPTNYTIDNGLTCVEAVRITDHWYRIRNEPRQVDVTSYTITISNIGPL